MKYIKLAVLGFAAVLLAGVLAQPARAEISFNLAYSDLSEHGSWLVSAQYGHVWQPREYNRTWNPYYDGHWVYSDMGWVWVSDYSWGSIPYHYGTWVADPEAGWVWIPGNVWAPSWVVFRTGPDYIGWAPVPPSFSVGMSLNLGGSSNFVFVSSRDFLSPTLRTSIVPIERTSTFINNTTVVNNIVVQNNVVVNRGPDYRTVEKATGRTIREEPIETVVRVAPYEHVSREQLAVNPENAKRGVRVAEPVPASQPLPAPEKPGNHGPSTAPPVAPRSPNAPSSAQPNTQDPAISPDAVIPAAGTDPSQKSQHGQKPPNQGKASAQQAPQPQANANPAARQAPEAQVNPTVAPPPSPEPQPNTKASPGQSAKQPANPQVNPEQGAKPPANPQANPEQLTKAQADAKAKADQKAKAQADAKAKKAKKKNPPPPKDPSADPNTAPGTKEEIPR